MKKPIEESKHQGYAFTDYICDLTFYEKIDKSKVRYLIIGAEVCPTSKRNHWQGFIYWKNDKYWNSMQKLMNPRFFEPMYHKSWPGANKNYCSKDGNLIMEFGDCPAQGRRTDLIELKHMLMHTNTAIDKVVIEHCENLQQIQFVEKLAKYRPNKRDKNEGVLVYWLYGPPGTGKTRYVWDKEPNLYKAFSDKWWDGYDGQEAVLIDDFREGWCSFARLLELTDRYPIKMEVKTTTTWAAWKRIYITSPYNIRNTFTNSENLWQLERRLAEPEIYFGGEENGGKVP